MTKYYRGGGDPGSPVLNEQYWFYVKSAVESTQFFSDSMFFFLESSEDEIEKIVQLRAMSSIMNSLLVLPALYRDEHSPFFQLINRGAISLGQCEIHEEENIFFGTAINDAYNLCNAQDWMGGYLHHSANEVAEKGANDPHNLVGFDAPLYEYDFNLIWKRDLDPEEFTERGYKDLRYSLNWYQSHPSIEKYCPEASKYNKPRPLWMDIMKGNILYYPDWPKIPAKKENTVDFARKIDKEYESSLKYRPIS